MPVQSQTTVMKSQQNRIEDNNNLIDKMRNDLSRASTSLTSLKGESCSTESTESVDISTDTDCV